MTVEKANANLESDRLDEYEPAEMGSWEWDLTHNTVLISDGLYRTIGLKPQKETPSFEDMMSLVHPDDLESVRQRIDDALASDNSFHLACRLIHPDGAIVHVRIVAVIQRDQDGKPQRLSGIVQSSTELENALAALRVSEHRFRSIVNTAVDAIITTNEAGLIESFNRAAEGMFGYKESEVLGENVHILMPPPYKEEHDTYLRNYLETGNAKIIGIGREVKGRRSDGSTFPLDLAVSEVIVEGRRIFSGVIKDVSDRRRLEQEILRISEQEQRRIGQDLHDGLGQMLTGIGLLSQHLARQLASIDDDAAEQAREITGLIRDADQQARALARGLVPVDIEVEGLTTALKRLSRNAQTLFGVECQVRIMGTPSRIEADTVTHLFRIAQEAVSNAVKHGRAKEVSVALAFAPDRVRLRVRDNGVGFPSKRSGESGMGVHIMHYRARIIGGSLDIRSIPDEGTSVTCTVPLMIRNQRK